MTQYELSFYMRFYESNEENGIQRASHQSCLSLSLFHFVLISGFVLQARVPEQIDTKIFDHPENSSYYTPFADRLDTSHVTDQSERFTVKPFTIGRLCDNDYSIMTCQIHQYDHLLTVSPKQQHLIKRQIVLLLLKLYSVIMFFEFQHFSLHSSHYNHMSIRAIIYLFSVFSFCFVFVFKIKIVQHFWGIQRWLVAYYWFQKLINQVYFKIHLLLLEQIFTFSSLHVNLQFKVCK